MEVYGGTTRVSATTQVVNAIRDAIRNGELKVGDRLPNETELAKTLGVGRSSFREGMRILNAYGVVEIRQGEGTFITNRCAEQIFEFLGFFPDDENLLHLIELRRIIECGSLRLAFQKLTEDDLRQLQELIRSMDTDFSTEKNIRSDRAFHELLIQAADNPLLAQVYAMLSKMQANLMSRLMCYDDVVEDAKQSHQEIAEALIARDEARCIDAMERHLDKVAEYYKQYYAK